MEVFLEILKIVVPVSIVCITFYLVIREFIDSQSEKRIHDSKKETEKIILPLKLQAYERATLFLERIAIESIILRVHKSGMSAKFLQTELSRTVRLEYEHNLAQQIYISETSWELIKNAKEETLKIFNMAGSKMNSNSTGLDLSQVIFQITTQIEKMPTQVALDHLKKEVSRIF